MNFRTALLGTTAAATAFIGLAPAAHAQRAADGNVKILYFQAVSVMNPYMSSGTKDVHGSSLVIEPLAGFDEKGGLVPRLVTEIPSVENGGISKDLTTITWKLTPGLKWSDGTPVTADDAVFTYEYCTNADMGCSQAARFQGIKTVEATDPQTIKITFTTPKPNPFSAFVGAASPVLQRAQFKDCVGAAAQTCTEQNTRPIGTGPFTVTDFKVNDVVQLAANTNYRDPAKPAFATVTLKGGGDARASARAVMETGEFDYAWNTQINPEFQAQLAAGGKGELISAFSNNVERIELNLTDPSPDLPEGERSTLKNPHPILSDVRVRRALSMAMDRQLLVDVGYGAAGKPTCNVIPAPEIYASPNTNCHVQDIEGAKALLEEAGWTDSNGDGIRDKDGKKLSLLFQTSVNAVRQDFQALVKGWWTQIGVETELKAIEPSVFFGGDPGTPDTYQRFYAEAQLDTLDYDGTDPEAYLGQYVCANVPGPGNGWRGTNINRLCDPAYEKLLADLSKTADLNERAKIIISMNDLLTKDGYVSIPLVDRARLSAKSKTLGGVVLNAWDSELWNASDWYRIK